LLVIAAERRYAEEAGVVPAGMGSVRLTFDGAFDAADFARVPGFTDLTVAGPTLRGRLAGHTDESARRPSGTPGGRCRAGRRRLRRSL
jgi:hypothetical protein